MDLSLPEIIQFQQTHQHDTAWSDHYGALYVAAEYCQIDLERNSFPHVWQHGSEGPWSSHPEMLVLNTPNAKEKKLFVARKQEENLLQSSGYYKAKAIGLPIVYLDQPPVTRTPNTLLIMPQHTLIVLKRGSEEARKQYVDSLRPYISSFDVVAACINPNCILSGYFIKEFKELGIEIIPGALSSDINALLRMRCLMEQFDTMTTNGWGTHMAYALAFGMKVSVCGEHFNIEDEELIKDVTWASYEEERRKSIRKEAVEGESKFISQFKSPPTQAISNKELGEWLIGVDCKQSPNELKYLFEWS